MNLSEIRKRHAMYKHFDKMQYSRAFTQAHQDRGKLLELVEKCNQLLLEATGLAAFGKGKSESYDRIFDDFIKKVQEECPDLFKLESEAGESTKDTQELHNCEEIKKVMKEERK